MDNCKADKTPYRECVAGLITNAHNNDIEILSMKSLLEYGSANGLIRFNFCPFCGDKLS